MAALELYKFDRKFGWNWSIRAWRDELISIILVVINKIGRQRGTSEREKSDFWTHDGDPKSVFHLLLSDLPAKPDEHLSQNSRNMTACTVHIYVGIS